MAARAYDILKASWSPFPGDLFAAVCRQFPDRIALRGNGLEISYREFEARTARQAAWLATQGVQPLDRVGLQLADPYDFVEAVVACLRLGAVYVPIDTRMPGAAVRVAVDAAQLGWLRVDPDLPFDPAGRARPLANLPATFDGSGVSLDRGPQDPRDPACIMFTSGSTGIPKGVICPLGGIVPLVVGAGHLQIERDDVVLQVSARAFDAFTWEVWGALLNGATLLLLPPIWTVSDLGRHIREGQVSAAFFTARLFDLLVETAPETLAGLRLIGFGGEQASSRHCALARRLLPHARLINGYGPTENTTFTCSYELGESVDANDPVPIGDPKGGDVVLLLDPDSLEPVEGEGVGELFVGGPGLALGYTDPDLTARRFIRLPRFGHRLFRTGDRAQRLADGQFQYLGRFDREVKLLGHRVDLFAVEQAIQRHPEVVGADVVLAEPRGRPELVTFYRTRDGRRLGHAALAGFLADKLAPNAVPHWFEHVAVPPLKPNGKVDVAAMVDGLRERVASVPADDPLTDLWRRILHPVPVCEATHFFKAGADSFAAIKLILDCEKALGVTLPADYLDRHPVLADFRRNLSSAAKFEPVTPAARHDGQPSLILVPWLMGAPDTFENVRPVLDFRGRIATLDMRRIDLDSAIRDVRTISADFADVLVDLGVTRASLVGASLGSAIALDLAAELAERGIAIDSVVMLDGVAPWLIAADDCLAALRWRVARVRRSMGRVRALLSRRESAPAAMQGNVFAPRPRRLSQDLGLWLRLRPRVPVAARIALVQAEGELLDPLLRWVAKLGWARLLPGLRVHRAKGGHLTMFDAVYGPRLAAQLSDLFAQRGAQSELSRAQSGNAAPSGAA